MPDNDLRANFAIYRVREDHEEAFLELLRKHHPTLLELDLVTADPPTFWRGYEKPGELIWFELFTWKRADGPMIAHQTPEVGQVWEAMGPLCEERDGRPKFFFPMVAEVDLGVPQG